MTNLLQLSLQFMFLGPSLKKKLFVYTLTEKIHNVPKQQKQNILIQL